MRPRTLAVLTALALLFAGYIFFVERRLPSTDERAEQEKKVLVFEPDEVEALEIAWDGQTVRLVRDASDDGDAGDTGDAGDEWRLERPLRARAERTAVDGLLDRLAGLEKERTIEDVERAAAGFETPRATITLFVPGAVEKSRIALELGPVVPASSSMIVARDGGATAYQVDGSLYDVAVKPPGDWRDKAVFAAARADIERVRLAPAGGDQVLLAERDDALWLESPVADRADRDLGTALLSALTGLRAARFVDPAAGETLDLAAYGLAPAPALGAIEVQIEDREAPVIVELGMPVPPEDGDEGDEEGDETGFDTAGGEAAADEVYARIGEQVFTAAAGALPEALARSADGWRSRRWLDLQVFEIERVEIADGEGELTLERIDGEWLRDGEVAIDYATASDLLYALAEVRAESVLDADSAHGGARLDGSDAARLTVSIRSEPGVEGDGNDRGDNRGDELRLAVYDPGGRAETGSGPGLLATASDRRAVLRLAPDALADVEAKLAAVRAAEAIADDEAEGEEPVQ